MQEFRCPRCDVHVVEAEGHDLEQCLAELRDQREGLHSAVDTLMRALKIALREHNQALARESLALEALKQAEDECDEAEARLAELQTQS
jgi:chromosome segregation ATPase